MVGELSPPVDYNPNVGVLPPSHEYITTEATILVAVLIVFYLSIILLLFGTSVPCGLSSLQPGFQPVPSFPPDDVECGTVGASAKGLEVVLVGKRLNTVDTHVTLLTPSQQALDLQLFDCPSQRSATSKMTPGPHRARETRKSAAVDQNTSSSSSPSSSPSVSPPLSLCPTSSFPTVSSPEAAKGEPQNPEGKFH